MGTIEGPGRRYDPTLNGGKGGWPDPPQPWLDDKNVAKARRAMDQADRDYQQANERWLAVLQQIAELRLRATNGPIRMPADGSSLYSADADDNITRANQLEETDQLSAREHRDRQHQRFIEARNDYNNAVTMSRRMYEPLPL